MDDGLRLVLSALLGGLLGGGVLYKLVVNALENHMRREFLPRSEAAGLGTRLSESTGSLTNAVERNAGLFVQLDDRVGDLEERTALIEERQTHQWERTGEQMSRVAETINDVTKRLERITEAQQEFALRLERLRRAGD